MSARQAFIPRPPSCTPSSETHLHPTDLCERDVDMLVNGNGKVRSISALLGHRRGTGADDGSQGGRPTQGPGLGRENTTMHRRSFEGILRPEMTPMSIIPYPGTKQQVGAGEQQPVAGQTPRKTGQSVFEFPRPITPASMPRSLKRGFRMFTEGREENALNANEHGSGIAFMQPGGEAEMHASAGAEIGGYMRVFEASGSGQNVGGTQSSLNNDIPAPMPVCAPGIQGANVGDMSCEGESAFARSLRSLDTMNETEVGMERENDARSFVGTKRGMRTENADASGWYIDDSHQAQRSAKRMRQAQHDPDEYLPISSPHVPPTPTLPSSSVEALDPSLVAGALFENIGEYVNLEEIEADWKRWRECSTEEWLKGAEKLVQEYTDILNAVKDRLTEKVMAYGRMISSVEERRKEVDRNIGIIHAKGEIVRENISQLGTKK